MLDLWGHGPDHSTLGKCMTTSEPGLGRVSYCVRRPSLFTEFQVSPDDPIQASGPCPVQATVTISACQDRRPSEEQLLQVWLLLSPGRKARRPKDRERSKGGHAERPNIRDKQVPYFQKGSWDDRKWRR
jgi:hypothetical protein